MAILVAHMRKRGDSNWGRPLAPALATKFEPRARQLHLTPEMYASSHEQRTWCKENRNRIYIPEWLLEGWGLTVIHTSEPSNGAAAAAP